MSEKYGLVLAGGGGKGAYEVGALKAVEELGLLKDVKGISATSIGAVNMVVTQGSSISKAYELWRNIDPTGFLELDDTGFNPEDYDDGLFTREGLVKLVMENMDASALNMPMYVTVCKRLGEEGAMELLMARGSSGLSVTADKRVLTDLSAAKKLDEGYAVPEYVRVDGLDKKSIVKWVLASSAIPLVYDAVEIGGVKYIDGGICDNTPIRPLYEEGFRNLIVISNDWQYRVPKEQYPDANILAIVPSHSLALDSILGGTEDLSRKNAAYRLELGYRDAIMSLPFLLKGERVPDLSGNHNIAMNALTMVQMSQRVSSNMDALDAMLKRYGI